MYLRKHFNIKSGYFSSYLMLVAVFTIPFSVTLSSFFFTAMVVVSLCEGDLRYKLYLFCNSPFTHWFIPGFLLVVLASFYSHGTWHESLYVIKKFTWLLYFPILIVSIDVNPIKKYFGPVLLTALVIMVFAAYVNSFYHFSFAPHERVLTFFQDRIKHGYLVLIGIILVLDRLRCKRNLMINGMILLFFIVNLIYVNDSRTGYIFLPLIILSTLIYGCESVKLKSVMLLIFPLMALLLVFSKLGLRVSHNGLESVQSYRLNDVNATSVGIRMDQWYYGGHALMAAPLLGHGTGMAGRAINQAQLRISGQQLHRDSIPFLVDCGIVNLFVQWGLIGLGYFISLFNFLIKQVKHALPENRYIYINVLLLNVAGSFINNWLGTTIPNHLFVILSVFCLSPTLLQRVSLPREAALRGVMNG